MTKIPVKNTKLQLIKQVVNKCVRIFDKYLTFIKSKKQCYAYIIVH